MPFAPLAVDNSILVFALGYGLCLIMPGPTLVVIVGVSLVRGFRGAIPICIGISVGAVVLGLAVFTAASAMPANAAWDRAGRAASGLLLLYVSWRLLKAAPPRSGDGSGQADFALGFITALFNPLTGSYLASQILVMRSEGWPASHTAMLGIVGGLALVRSLAIVALIGGMATSVREWTGMMRLAQGAGAIFALIAIWLLVSAALGAPSAVAAFGV